MTLTILPRHLFPLALFSVISLFFVPSTARAQNLAKFEPARGCYIGAFIERDFTVQGNIEVFEELTKKKHASYFTYVGFGRPFPKEWVDKVKMSGAAPHIAFEPNEGLDVVKDDQYLRNWARDAARSNCPIFLRWASEMNGPWTAYGKNPEQYREKFRLMHRIMAEEAPNVAMVWTPFAEPQRLIEQYYPGDDAVDWVGLNIYSVYVNNGDPLRPANQKDPLEWLQFIYDNYAARKPIHISEFAATIFCRGTGGETIPFAIEKMTRFYDGIRQHYPRVKSVNYFVWDTIRAKRANNNYSFIDDGRVLATYRQLVANDHFLTKVAYDPRRYAIRPRAGTTVGGGGSRREVDAEAVESSGAIAGNLGRPYLRGIEDGQVVATDLDLRAQLPIGMRPKGLIWQIDGKAVALTNKSPYRATVYRDRIGPGKHRARLIVLTDDPQAPQQESPEIEFEFAP
jgi:hypothetical protein